MSGKLQQITPFVLCSSLEAQIAFYRDKLGFELGFQAENYAFLKREAVAIRLLECPPRPDGLALGQDQSFYIDVSGLDALYAELSSALSDLPAHRVRAPFDQPYGQREFHVLDEDGTLVFFGESLN